MRFHICPHCLEVIVNLKKVMYDPDTVATAEAIKVNNQSLVQNVELGFLRLADVIRCGAFRHTALLENWSN